jgi:AcrR family transcriptional regulator
VPRERSATRTKSNGGGALGHPRGKVPAEQRLDEIFQVAAAQFQTRGFGATRLDDIAEALGVTRAALYYYFKSKDELIEFVCSHNMERAESALRVAREESNPLDQLRAFAQRYAPVIVADAAIVTFRERGELRPVFRRRLMARAQAITAGVDDLTLECVRTGVFRKDLDPGLAALSLLGMLGWCSQWFPHSDRTLDDVVDGFFDIFVRGVSPGAALTEQPSAKVAAAHRAK